MADGSDALHALDRGGASVDLSNWRKVRVGGADAVTWLHDLLTADIASLEPGEARRSLLLTATGRIRADVQVARDDDSLLLFQAPDQPEHIGLLLSPYVLSSDVELHDATSELALLAVPGAGASLVGHRGFEPSSLGPGVDLVASSDKEAWRLGDALLKAGLVEADAEAVERWRIVRGVARMGSDFGTDSLPAEARLEHTIDATKGCFLGQESVARIRNLGHPTRILRHLRTPARAVRGDRVLLGGREVGLVTSATSDRDHATVLLAMVRWEAAEETLTLDGDLRLADVGSSG
jgi:folate-binding protein YgfZ